MCSKERHSFFEAGHTCLHTFCVCCDKVSHILSQVLCEGVLNRAESRGNFVNPDLSVSTNIVCNLVIFKLQHLWCDLTVRLQKRSFDVGVFLAHEKHTDWCPRSFVVVIDQRSNVSQDINSLSPLYNIAFIEAINDKEQLRMCNAAVFE